MKQVDWDKLENLPYRQNRWQRYTEIHGSFWDFHHWRKTYRWCKLCDIILKNNIGKSYDMAYHYLCTKVPYQYRHWFEDEFNYHRWRSYYYVDENGLIQREKDILEKHVVVKSDDWFEGYVNKQRGKLLDSFSSYHRYEIKRELKSGRGMYYETAKKGLYINGKLLKEITVFDTFYNRAISYNWVTIGEKKIYSSKNDPKYKRYYAEKQQARKKQRKLEWKEKQEKQYSFLTKSELEIKNDFEKNKICIIKHGFDPETSFKFNN